MSFDYVGRSDRLRLIETLTESFSRCGVSKSYAAPFAQAYAEDSGCFWEVNGPNIRLLRRRGIPAEYAIEAVRLGRSLSEVHELWSQGIPLEYVTA
jgi:hypothetical protein